MSERYWRRPMPMAAVLLAAAGAAALTGCGASAGTGAASSTATAGLAANAGQAEPAAFTATQLQAALLGTVNGKAPVAPAEAGAYGALPDVEDRKSVV